MTADIYITKYALSYGIGLYALDHIDGDMAVVRSRTGMNRTEIYHRPYWHADKEEAITRAELMRRNKIASLAKQAEKLKRLDFDTKLIIIQPRCASQSPRRSRGEEGGRGMRDFGLFLIGFGCGVLSILAVFWKSK